MEIAKSLVSVIVPAYNVEAYIETCLRSILAQSHGNLELIVVNDGSTDDSPIIVEAIAKQDSRVRLIHQDNAGVSAARNTGLAAATGEYIVFVDGDDFLAPDYIEYMLDLAAQTGAEFCLSKRSFSREGEEQTKNQTVETLSPAQATALLLCPDVFVGCWNKIYKKELLDRENLRFSTSLFYGEGLSFITTAAQKASCVGVGNRKVYYYRRNNENSATTRFDIRKIYNGEKALGIIGEQLTVDDPQVKAMLKLHLCNFYLGSVVRIRANQMVQIYREDYRRWLRFVRRNAPGIVFSKYITLYRKALILGGSLFPGLITKMDIARRRNIVKNSVVDK